MSSAINIYMSLHTQISRAEKQMRKSGAGKTERHLACFGNDILDGDLIGGEKSLSGDATILLKGERGTHKFALAANYLFQGLKNGENVILFNMGSAVDIKRIPQCMIKGGKRLSFRSDHTDNENNLEFMQSHHIVSDRPPEGKYTLHWWVSRYGIKPGEKKCCGQNGSKRKDISHILQNHANLFMLDFDAGFLLPEEFIATFINLVEWIKDKGKEPTPMFQRILLNTTAMIKTRFPMLEEESFLIPAFIRLTKCYGISSMIIDVMQPPVAGVQKEALLDALSDLIITLEHNWQGTYKVDPQSIDKKLKIPDANELKIVTADNITGKVYEKRWLGLWIEEAKADDKILKVVNVSKESEK
ncbi:MAG: hypothetical protein NT166_19930 [Candidatus Aminicenantes bacterium]|nr:hypothetical protein [Candidatus Aminicenantes bacterium]